MAAWIGPYWPEDRRGLDDDEMSRRRMVEFMLGPLIATKPALHQQFDSEQPLTLNLLSSASHDPAQPLLSADNMGGTHVELEPEMPLPSGWEKCLNLKTGSIYYLNRTTGATSTSDPRKQASHNKVSYVVDVSSSPTTSELTVEASYEDANTKPQISLNVNEKPMSLTNNIESELDLNLSLHVGSCCSLKPILPPQELGALSLLPSPSVSPSKIKVSVSTGVSSASSSSSSTSSPISASLAFSQRILSSKQLSQPSPPQSRAAINEDSNQSTRFGMKGSSFYGDLHNSLSDYVRNRGEANGQKLAKSEELPSTAMVTVACANCLMFVMLSRSNPRCPRCGTNCPEQMEFPQQSPLKKARLGFSF